MAVTPLQLANAYAAFANGGTLWKPHIGARRSRPDTAAVAEDVRAAGRSARSPFDAERARQDARRLRRCHRRRSRHCVRMRSAASRSTRSPSPARPAPRRSVRRKRAGVTRRSSPRTSRPTRRTTSSSRSSKKAGSGAQTAAPIVRRVIESMNGIAAAEPVHDARRRTRLMATLTAGPLAVSRRRSAVEASPLRHLDLVLLVVPFLHQRARPADDLLVDPRPARPGRYRLDVLRRSARRWRSASVSIAMVVMIAIDYRRLRDLWALVYLAMLPLLAACWWSARPARARRRGSTSARMQFQPSEIAKVAVIIAVAGYCHQHRGDLDAWRLAVARR